MINVSRYSSEKSAIYSHAKKKFMESLMHYGLIKHLYGMVRG